MKYAQSLPKNQPPIQRVIEEVDSGGTPISGQATSEAQANSTVLFGLGAILLVIIAIGATAMFWRRSRDSGKPGASDTEPLLPEMFTGEIPAKPPAKAVSRPPARPRVTAPTSPRKL